MRSSCGLAAVLALAACNIPRVTFERGDATGGPPAFSVTPTTVNFGGVTLGSTDTAKFTVTNTGGGDLMPSFTAPTSAQFAVASSTCSAAIAPAATCTISVAYSPTTIAPGSAMLTASAAGAPDVTLSVVGTPMTWVSELPNGESGTDFLVVRGLNPTPGSVGPTVLFGGHNNGMPVLY